METIYEIITSDDSKRNKILRLQNMQTKSGHPASSEKHWGLYIDRYFAKEKRIRKRNQDKNCN